MECAFEDLKYFESCFQEIYIVVENGLNCKYTGRDDIKGRVSEETKLKMSNTKKKLFENGEIITWHKGKTGVYSEEIIKKFSYAKKRLYENGYISPLKGRGVSDEQKEYLKNLNIGRKASEETKQKMSEKRKGRKVSEETKIKIGEKNKGKNPSEESRKKMSEAQKKRFANGQIHPMGGKTHSEETRKKLSENHWSKKDTYISPQGKKVINTETKEVYNSAAECERKTGYKKLQSKLSGSRKNNTPFKYL
jgi:hypothetical protein